MSAKKPSRREAKSPQSTSAKRRKSRKPDDPVATPVERMGYILKHYDEHANMVSHNPLVYLKTPKEALVACRELTETLYSDLRQGNDGRQYIYLMLSYALRDIEEHLGPLFDCARQVAEPQS